MSERPKFRIVAKSKKTQAFQNIFAIWENEKGCSGVLDRDVAKIVLTNGAVITNEGCWFNLYVDKPDEHNQDVAPKAEDNQNQEVDYPDDECPF